jgi:nitroreductase
MLKKLVIKNRSCRRFKQNSPIPSESLKELIDLARLCPSGANKQPLKYIISNEAGKNSFIFPALAWAGYLKDWPGPKEGEKPSAYIIILCDTEISENPGCDHGIAAQTILLGAAEKNLGGCIIGSIQRQELQESLKIPQRYKILLVLALGEPAEKIILQDTDSSQSIEYFRDSGGAHHVPKRKLEDIIISL